MVCRAVERGGMGDFSDVETDVLCGDALLWLAWDGTEMLACAVTILQQGDDKFCTILACAGKSKCRWVGLLAGLEKFAKAEGCKSMKVCGRKGWLRELDGYRLTRVVLEKELS